MNGLEKHLVTIYQFYGCIHLDYLAGCSSGIVVISREKRAARWADEWRRRIFTEDGRVYGRVYGWVHTLVWTSTDERVRGEFKRVSLWIARNKHRLSLFRWFISWLIRWTVKAPAERRSTRRVKWFEKVDHRSSTLLTSCVTHELGDGFSVRTRVSKLSIRESKFWLNLIKVWLKRFKFSNRVSAIVCKSGQIRSCSLEILDS